MPARTPAGSRPSPSHRASAGKSRRLSPRLPVPVPPAPSQPRPGPFPVRPVPTSPLLLLPPHTARPEEAELGADGGKERGPSSREKPPANRRTRGYVAPNGRAERVGEGAERPRGSPLPSLGRGACWELAASLPPPPPRFSVTVVWSGASAPAIGSRRSRLGPAHPRGRKKAGSAHSLTRWMQGRRPLAPGPDGG